MCKTADGLILLLNTLCLIENNALLAFKLIIYLLNQLQYYLTSENCDINLHAVMFYIYASDFQM